MELQAVNTNQKGVPLELQKFPEPEVRNKNISMKSRAEKTKAQQSVEKKILSAKNKLDYYKAEFNNPDTKPKRKAELRGKIRNLNGVYSKTSYEIDANGNVKFTFNGDVNVAVFKEAYGLKDKSLRPYLTARHQVYMQDFWDYKQNPPIKLYDKNGKEINVENPEMYFEQNLGSKLVYEDGYAEYSDRSWLGGWTPVPDYDGMSFGPEENNALGKFKASEFK